MRIPSRNTAGWAREIIQQCEVSMKWRIQRGAYFRNFLQTGTPDGEPATYNKVYEYLDTLSSWLYSPSDLRFAVQPKGRSFSPAERAKMIAATDELHSEISDSDTDVEISQGVLWSLAKGKSFIKQGWADDRLEAYVVQPESMGVLREDIKYLAQQEAFFHRMWLTRGRFMELIENHPDHINLARKAQKYLLDNRNGDRPGSQPTVPLSLGGQAFSGSGPYRAGAQPTNNAVKNFAYWLSAPTPVMDPEVLARMVALDELWVWDSARGDYTTIQIIGDDLILEGQEVHRNLFADAIDSPRSGKKLAKNPDNPLAYRQPFDELCGTPVDGYFWGRSEIENVAPLQLQLNARIDGVNKILRRQEDPPTFVKGMAQSAQFVKSRLSKPGGYLVDANPNGTVQQLSPTLPPDLYNSQHETERMFNQMGGFPAVLRGEGDPGVRAQGHAAQLTANASPRHKDRALLYERQIGSIGTKAYNILKAKISRTIVGWVMPGVQSVEITEERVNLTLEPPAPGMKPIEFLMSQLPEDWRVVVADHSSSQAFVGDTRKLAFDLNARGAVGPEQLVEMVHPPGEEKIMAEIERKEVAQAAFVAQHPEALAKGHVGGKKK